MQHVCAGVVTGGAEGFPPIGQFFVHLAHFGTQSHEIETGTKPRLLDQTKRGAAVAFIKTRLHGPDFAHITRQFAPARHIANAGIEHVFDGFLQSGKGGHLGAAHLPTFAYIGPQHTSEQKAGCNRFALAYAAVGVLQSGMHKVGFHPLDHHIQQRVNATGHA